jgi:hypothetical protein
LKESPEMMLNLLPPWLEDPSLNENDNIKPEINKYGNKLKNPDVLNNLNEKLSHLDTDQRNELKD